MVILVVKGGVNNAKCLRGPDWKYRGQARTIKDLETVENYLRKCCYNFLKNNCLREIGNTSFALLIRHKLQRNPGQIHLY